MTIHERIEALVKLAGTLPEILVERTGEARAANPWFTETEIRLAGNYWREQLSSSNLTLWISPYLPLDPSSKADIFVITAGNLPLVGFHDLLCVILSGNRFYGRLSSKDSVLMRAMCTEMIRIEPRWRESIHLGSEPENPDGAIATGSNNSTRYFNALFRGIPSIIRGNRTSVSLLSGTESDEDLQGIASDITAYYGLGCRSISHLFLPDGYPLQGLLHWIGENKHLLDNQMYRENLRYQKARLGLSGRSFLNAETALLVEEESLFSPIGVVNYSYYRSPEEVSLRLIQETGNLQCITGSGYLPHGTAQNPSLWDYADGTDTLKFLKSIHRSE